MSQHKEWICSHCGAINKDYYLNCMSCASFRKTTTIVPVKH